MAVAIGTLAVIVMAGTSAYAAWQSTDQGIKADAAAKKAQAQAEADRAQADKDRADALKAQADYKLMSQIGIGISVISLIVFAYMIFRRPS